MAHRVEVDTWDDAFADGDADALVADVPYDARRMDCKGCTEEELAYQDVVVAVVAAAVVAKAVFACKHSLVAAAAAAVVVAVALAVPFQWDLPAPCFAPTAAVSVVVFAKLDIAVLEPALAVAKEEEERVAVFAKHRREVRHQLFHHHHVPRSPRWRSCWAEDRDHVLPKDRVRP